MKTLFTFVLLLLASIYFIPSSEAQTSTACASDPGLNNSGTFKYMVYDLDPNSSSYGVIVWTDASAVDSVEVTSGSEQFVLPFSFPTFEYLYAQLLLVQQDADPTHYRLDFHKDSDHLLCSLTVIDCNVSSCS